MKYTDIFTLPVVMLRNNTVERYYPTLNSTIQDNLNPYKVALVCSHGQKTYKGKVFRLASEMDILAYGILKELQTGGGVKCNT